MYSPSRLTFSPVRFAWTGLLLLLHLGLAPAANGGELTVLAELAQLTGVGSQQGDEFGLSVSIDGDRLVVGAPDDNNQGTDSGAAYVFERDATGAWVSVTKLVAPDGAAGEGFGNSVSILGDHIAVGAVSNSDVDLFSGAAYLYQRQIDGTWTFVSQLLSPNGSLFDFFGNSVSIADGLLAVGAPGVSAPLGGAGAAYIFELDEQEEWILGDSLFAGDPSTGDSFGGTVSLDLERLAVSAEFDDDGANNAGAAYLFERQVDGSWAQVEKLIASDASSADAFSFALSLQGDELVVGARTDNNAFGDDAGSAYIYKRSPDGTWTEEQKLTASDGEGREFFGHAVTHSGDRLVVSANGAQERGFNAGAAYLFERQPGEMWVEVAKLFSQDTESLDNFGDSVSIDGDSLAVGVSSDDPAGSVSIFEPATVSPELLVSGTCPGEVTLEFSGMTPRDQANLAGAPQVGTTQLGGGPCAGVTLDLDSPSFLVQVDANFNGASTLVRTVSEALCGRQLQFLDLRTCLTSNVVSLP